MSDDRAPVRTTYSPTYYAWAVFTEFKRLILPGERVPEKRYPKPAAGTSSLAHWLWRLATHLASVDALYGGGGGSYLPLAGGTMAEEAQILWQNGSADREAPGGAGREIECSIGFRLQWIAGRLILRNTANQIVRVISIAEEGPSAGADVTADYAVDCLWHTRDGLTHKCTDNSVGAAVWVVFTGIPAPTNEEIALGTGTEARVYTPAQVTAQVRAQQVHHGDTVDYVQPEMELNGVWPGLFSIAKSYQSTIMSFRLLGEFPVLQVLTLDYCCLLNAAQANLLADVARNAQEHGITGGTLDMSGNPGTLDLADPAVAAALSILSPEGGLAWTVSYPALPVGALQESRVNNGDDYNVTISLSSPPDYTLYELERTNDGAGAWYLVDSGQSPWGGHNYTSSSGQTAQFRVRLRKWGFWGQFSEALTVTT
jgi:hypothetical protein